ncbi:hypothetical protein BS47DRAFT_1377466 [Hydnum rufescens UP504]|uniref:TauD/TfdA-like domain-containing protein n=1 Tax=Hydnum rufescens UP504 TaxID=1448309 RepID=A0A9P6ARP3_9AGAM|nr:hypothetical protein BS47DRAFT_1377466 [Hydnum rufescens UP504]
MAPTAQSKHGNQIAKPNGTNASFNPFYSPPPAVDFTEDYEYNKYKPTFPKVDWEPLTEFEVSDRGLRADPAKKALLSAATKVDHITPAIGTRLQGLDLRQLSDTQKDELALLVAERSVVVFEDQAISIHEQLELARSFGPLHKHATTAVPAEPGLEEVHVVYSDGSRPPDTTAYSQLELFHSDVTYEIQPPGTTSLKLISSPSVGGDTLWSSGYALYSSLSPFFQKYLESLSALHSAAEQAQGSRAAGTHVRREEIETIHPVVRVHPVTGWKSVFVNPGFTRKIVGVPKAESDAVLTFLFRQISENAEFQVRVRWSKNQVVFWDNRVKIVALTLCYIRFFPRKRHALRATPQAEKPLSVQEIAKDRQKEIWKSLGYDPDKQARGGTEASNDLVKAKVYND